MMIDMTYILTVALAAAFVLMAVALLVAVMYYRWRLRDSHRTLARFIRENILLNEKIDHEG